jgi:hypothetical protein
MSHPQRGFRGGASRSGNLKSLFHPQRQHGDGLYAVPVLFCGLTELQITSDT